MKLLYIFVEIITFKKDISAHFEIPWAYFIMYCADNTNQFTHNEVQVLF